MSKHAKNIIWGLLLIAVGAGYLGELFELWKFTLFFPGWWSLFLILPACISQLKYGIQFMMLMVLSLGVYFLADANHWIDFRLSVPLVAAVGCICAGLHLLFARRTKWYEYGCKD